MLCTPPPIIRTPSTGIVSRVDDLYFDGMPARHGFPSTHATLAVVQAYLLHAVMMHYGYTPALYVPAARGPALGNDPTLRDPASSNVASIG